MVMLPFVPLQVVGFEMLYVGDAIILKLAL
jgi:hypothetical protein